MTTITKARVLPRDTKNVFVVDDHPLARAGVKAILQDDPGLAVCGESAEPAEALRMIEILRPDVVIVDLSLQQYDGLSLIAQIVANDNPPRVVVFTMYDELLHAQQALHAGASGYVMKTQSPGDLRAAVQRVLAGQIALSRSAATKLTHQKMKRHAIQGLRRGTDQLSDRERQVFTLIGQGLGTRQIAQRLNLSIKTIETYRANLKDKLKIENGHDLLFLATHWHSRSP
jgi:DNA-binding NarL/FixJ family response regulator